MRSILSKASLLLALTLCALAAIAAPASADAPLEGVWRFGQQATVEFKQTSANHFAGTIRTNGSVACPGNVNGVQVTEKTLVIELADPAHDTPDLVAALVGAGARITSVVEDAPTLEEAYLSLVGEHGERDTKP